MKTSWIIGLWVLFIGGSLISGITEMQFLSGSTNEVAVFNRLMTQPVLADANVFTIVGAVVKMTINWFFAFWDMLLWNYAFLTGGWAIFKWIVLYPISAGFIASIIMAVRGTSSA